MSSFHCSHAVLQQLVITKNSVQGVLLSSEVSLMIVESRSLLQYLRVLGIETGLESLDRRRLFLKQRF